MKAVVLLSGGLDSTTLAYFLNRSERYDIHALSFDYGQRHRKELVVAENIAQSAGWDWHSIRLAAFNGVIQQAFGMLLPGSALTDSRVDVPHGHYADDSMKVTVVPNRNTIMLALAYSVALAEFAEMVAFAAHAGDHAIYPDCRPAYVDALNIAFRLGNAWDDMTPVPRITAPFIHESKGEIAVIAHNLGVPIADTWSCYEGGIVHCGKCGTCVERKEALEYARTITGKEDPTIYVS